MDNAAPLVSIIIPCYNQARYLTDALASVASQTYPHWECLIVNDGSPDNTEQIALQWVKTDQRFKYIKKENGGPSSARNAGLRVAGGEYIQFLDADDLLETRKIEHQIAYLKNGNEAIDVVISGYRYFQDADESRELHIMGPFHILPEVFINKDDKKDLSRLFAKTNPMVMGAPLYHKRVFDRIGRFDESLGGNEDWDLHFRCAAGGIIFQHIGYLPDSKTLIRIHEGSLVTDQRRMLKSLKRLRQKHRDRSEFAVENVSCFGDEKKRASFWIKMVTPPAMIWFVQKILKR